MSVKLDAFNLCITMKIIDGVRKLPSSLNIITRTYTLFNTLLIFYHLYPEILNHKNPYFIELGGHDGITESNTLALNYVQIGMDY